MHGQCISKLKKLKPLLAALHRTAAPSIPHIKAVTRNWLWVRGVVFPLSFLSLFFIPSLFSSVSLRLKLWVGWSAVSCSSEVSGSALAANASSCISSRWKTFDGCKCSTSVEGNVKTEASVVLWLYVIMFFYIYIVGLSTHKTPLVTSLVRNLSSHSASPSL